MGAVSLFGVYGWVLDAKSAERTDADEPRIPRGAVTAVPLDLDAPCGGQVGVAPTSR